MTTKARSQQLERLAQEIIEDLPGAEVRDMALELVELGGCHYEAAKKIIRRVLNREGNQPSNWGGPRPGAGHPNTKGK